MRLFLLAVVGFFLLSSGVGSGRSSFGPLIFDPASSPNGKWIAFSGGPFGEPGGIFLVRPDGRGFHRLTPKSLDAAGPVWAPDGRDILFVTVGSGLGRLRDRELYVMKADGSMLRRLTRNAADDTPSSVAAISQPTSSSRKRARPRRRSRAIMEGSGTSPGPLRAPRLLVVARDSG